RRSLLSVWINGVSGRRSGQGAQQGQLRIVTRRIQRLHTERYRRLISRDGGVEAVRERRLSARRRREVQAAVGVPRLVVVVRGRGGRPVAAKQERDLQRGSRGAAR